MIIFEQFGLLGKTGSRSSGEAATIMHKEENIGQVELATMSFGQSFQVTPIQMAATVSALVNGGKRVTPHFGVRILDKDKRDSAGIKNMTMESKSCRKKLPGRCRHCWKVLCQRIREKCKDRRIPYWWKDSYVSDTSRSANKYISSFIGFAPAANPQILGMCVIYNPQGVYYGGNHRSSGDTGYI